MSKSDRCEICRFFKDNGWKDPYGWCRKNPPITVWSGANSVSYEGMVTRFPRVDKASWCGEFLPADSGDSQ